jgi:hypothetical protein
VGAAAMRFFNKLSLGLPAFNFAIITLLTFPLKVEIMGKCHKGEGLMAIVGWYEISVGHEENDNKHIYKKACLNSIILLF